MHGEKTVLDILSIQDDRADDKFHAFYKWDDGVTRDLWINRAEFEALQIAGANGESMRLEVTADRLPAPTAVEA